MPFKELENQQPALVTSGVLIITFYGYRVVQSPVNRGYR